MRQAVRYIICEDRYIMRDDGCVCEGGWCRCRSRGAPCRPLWAVEVYDVDGRLGEMGTMMDMLTWSMDTGIVKLRRFRMVRYV